MLPNSSYSTQDSVVLAQASPALTESLNDLENGYSAWSSWAVAVALGVIGLLMLTALAKFALSKL